MLRSRFQKVIKDNTSIKEQSSQKDISIKESPILPDLNKTIETFKSIYSYTINQDVIIRHIHISGLNKQAAILFIDTITKTQHIEDVIIKPLLSNKDANRQIIDIISNNSIKTKKVIKDVLVEINKGNVALFIHGESEVYVLNAAQFEGRN
ncbi:hypothetical protein GCM10008025_32980 [Ornithinibacillus halotolerans]|uniref:GerA spore germination protein n=1 Tax=Ornithinibacillus halotolerans TaxID=1274357 RepID=A0A916WD50_9BACI|nr:hypothetical protein GCM10008025_32980 [Ornithinibacillus halotolerans]